MTMRGKEREMDQAIREERFGDHTRIEDEDKGFRVSTTNNGFQWWSVGTIFPTREGAEKVAVAIESALSEREEG
jgi:hypothetical protein